MLNMVSSRVRPPGRQVPGVDAPLVRLDAFPADVPPVERLPVAEFQAPRQRRYADPGGGVGQQHRPFNVPLVHGYSAAAWAISAKILSRSVLSRTQICVRSDPLSAI
jgi:hypothetical protein